MTNNDTLPYISHCSFAHTFAHCDFTTTSRSAANEHNKTHARDRASFAPLASMLAHDSSCPPRADTDSYRDDCRHDDLAMLIRDFLCSINPDALNDDADSNIDALDDDALDYFLDSADDYPLITESDARMLLIAMRRDLLAPYCRDALSRAALDDSLCPMHFCDYQICFDDDDAECALIRSIFPSHDS